MNQSVRFVVDDATKSALLAAGVEPPGMEVGPLPCPFHVGDTISFPGSKQLAFEVMHRHLEMRPDGSVEWKVALRPSENPIVQPETYRRSVS